MPAAALTLNKWEEPAGRRKRHSAMASLLGNVDHHVLVGLAAAWTKLEPESESRLAAS